MSQGEPRIVTSESLDEAQADQAWREQVELELGRLVSLVEDFPTALEEQVAIGVTEGIRKAVEDHTITEKFWQTGYERLTQKGSDGLSKWAGRRLLTWIGGILISAGIYLAVKGGFIK